MADSEFGPARGLRKLIFASDDLPPGLDDESRFRLWREIYSAQYGSLDLGRLPDQPFSARFECAQLGSIRFAQFDGTMSRIARTRRHIAADAVDDFFLGLNRGRSPIFSSQLQHETILDRGNAVLLSNAEAGEVRAEDKNSWFLLAVPRVLLNDLMAEAEDLLAKPLDPNGAALRHLRRYLDLLLAPEGIDDDPPLLAHVGATLADLIALVLGADRDATEVARMRGLRAARAQEVLAEIRTGIADPGFSTSMVAQKLGLSPRYIQELLQQTGRTFSERVLELRLQKARAMLSDARHDRLKVSDIALACGFNEVSYFNRCFRRRFGASPTQYRGGNGHAEG